MLVFICILLRFLGFLPKDALKNRINNCYLHDHKNFVFHSHVAVYR